MLTPSSSVARLPGVGPATLAALGRLGVTTLRDLLRYAPVRYEDFSRSYTLAEAPLGVPLTLQGRISKLTNRRSWKNRRLAVTEGMLTDSTGAVKLVWFGQPFLAKAIPLEITINCSGVLEERSGTIEMVNPVWERASRTPIHTQRLVPDYALTRGLTGKQIRMLVDMALAQTEIVDYLDAATRRRSHLIDLSSALHAIHFPKSTDEATQARRRLAFDELLFLHLSRATVRRQREQTLAPIVTGKVDHIISRLPFTLTTDQIQSIREIVNDMGHSYPMQRLLQGEVGSGKTAVAAVAAAVVAETKGQALYLAPTSVLARQQYESLCNLLASLPFDIGLLTSTESETRQGVHTRSALRQGLKEGTISIVIGTHALLEHPVAFHNLSLVIVDEQHRFGVLQRQAAQAKRHSERPHLLAMTATPIPRTLQLAFMGDVDVSTLHTLPHGQRQVKTLLFVPADRHRVEVAIRRRIARGEQVFVVCPLIDPSDKLGVKSVTAEYERLRRESFQDVKIGLLHGKLKAEEKNQVLREFRTGHLQMLVATSVIEVGVDIPEAQIMIIEGAERFGLAQLHQLRGRVGRRGGEGVCALFTEIPSSAALKRLHLFTTIHDGFRLAEADLILRGPGDWFGVRQSGFAELRFADLQDTALVYAAQQEAQNLLNTKTTADLSAPLQTELAHYLQHEGTVA